MTKTLILIPSRLSAKRLPGKPLLKINNISIISHVYNNALATKIGDVFVATEDIEIIDDIEKNGGKAILTSKHHKTGTDRIFEAYKKLNLPGVNYILNLQGDEPIINSDDVIRLNEKITKSNFDMGTLGCRINDKSNFVNENIVKVKTKEVLDEKNYSKAIKFFRKINDHNENNLYKHLGIYIYKVEILEKIVSLQQTENEKKNKLEQLRALENNIDICTVLAERDSISVDTKEDYVKIKTIMEK